MSAPSPARASRPRLADRLAGVSGTTRALAALTAFAALLRFATLGSQSYWLDEAVTVYLVRLPFADLFDGISFSESTPPLYYLLAWLWAQLFGTGEAALRSLSALAGTATVPVAYAAAARFVTARAGLVVAALAAVNPLLVWFSQEARAYALLVLLGAAGLAVFARVVERPTGRGLAAWALLSALALATHYFAAFAVAPQAAWLVWRMRGRAELRATLAAVGAVALAGGALLPLMLEQAGNDRADFIGRIDLAKRIAQVPKQYLVGFDAPLEAFVTVVALALAGVGLVLLARRAGAHERRGALRAAAIAAAIVLVPLVLAIAGVDYLIARNVIVAWVPAAIALGAGFGAVRAGRAGIAGAAALCAVSLAVVVAVAADPTYQRGDWRAAGRALAPLQEPRALVISPLAGQAPLGLYTARLHPYPGFALPLREIYVIAVAERRAGQTPEPPRPARPPPPPAGFTLVEKRYAESYTLLRYRSETYSYLFWWQLGPLKLSRGLPEIQVQIPDGWKWVPEGSPPRPAPPGHR